MPTDAEEARRAKRRRKKKRPPNKAAQYAVYLAVKGLATVFQAMPIEVSMTLASGFAELMYRLDGRHRVRSRGNVEASFPDTSAAFHHRLTRESFRLFPFLAIEFLLSPRYVRRNRFHRHIQFGPRMGEVLKLLIEQERGVLLVSGHYGNWEVLGYTLAEMGFGTSAVARPLDNPYLYELVLGIREKKGQRILDKKGAIAELPAVLEAKGAVGFMADQDAGKRGMFVDFFGRQASTYKSIGVMAMRYDVPIVIGFGRRVKDDLRFLTDVVDVIHPQDWKAQNDPLRYITERYTRGIETSIRGEPGQYLWLHRRWKTRPEDVPARQRPATS
ncbi:MAG: lipid A biosynthesis acyltransferase [Planctomycetota bacterium]